MQYGRVEEGTMEFTAKRRGEQTGDGETGWKGVKGRLQ
jgi:hypothetical protein